MSEKPKDPSEEVEEEEIRIQTSEMEILEKPERPPKAHSRPPTYRMLDSIKDPRRPKVGLGVKEQIVYTRQNINEIYYKDLSEEFKKLIYILKNSRFISLVLNREVWNDQGLFDLKFIALKDHRKAALFLDIFARASERHDFISFDYISRQLEQLRNPVIYANDEPPVIKLKNELKEIIELLLCPDDKMKYIEGLLRLEKLGKEIMKRVQYLINERNKVKLQTENDEEIEELCHLKMKIERRGFRRKRKLAIVRQLIEGPYGLFETLNREDK